MAEERQFPIQGDPARRDPVSGFAMRRKPGSVPWSIAEVAYRQYATHYGNGQTLERLAERGGFGWMELVSLLRGGRGNDRIDDLKPEKPDA